MTLTINTNISSLIAQRNMKNATNNLNLSIERMSTGYKINHAKDNAAGYSIADKWETQIGSLDVAADNAATGADLLTTAEQTYSLLTSHLQRVRDLTEQAANGTYGSTSLRAIQAEIYGRLQEIDRISANAEFNGIKLMSYNDSQLDQNQGVGITSRGLTLQVGLYSNGDSIINMDISLFKSAAVSSLFRGGSADVFTTDKNGDVKVKNVTLESVLNTAGGSVAALNTQDGLRALSAACSGLKYTPKGPNQGEGEYSLLSDELDSHGAAAMLGFIDAAIEDLATRVTKIGAIQNRVESSIIAIDVQSQNITSSLSTLKDCDVAEESSIFIQSQILQQASATLLATANQTPSIALNLV